MTCFVHVVRGYGIGPMPTSLGKIHEPPAGLTIGIVELGESVLLATDQGVLSWNGEKFSFVLKGADTNFLVRIGAAAFALGSEGGVWTKRGRRVEVDRCSRVLGGGERRLTVSS